MFRSFGGLQSRVCRAIRHPNYYLQKTPVALSGQTCLSRSLAVLASWSSVSVDDGPVPRLRGASLAVVAPSIATQWHPTKNGAVTPADVTSQTDQKYWWQCAVAPDHEWEASPKSRVGQGTGCPCCAGQKVSVTNSLATCKPTAAALWHPTLNGDLTPADVVAGTGKKYWFQGLVDGKCFLRSGAQWPFEVRHHYPSERLTLAEAAPAVAAQWHPIKNGDVTPVDVTSQTGTKYWWQCDVAPDHEWEASPASRVGSGSGCPCCAGQKVSVTNSLATVAPDVAAQWHRRNGAVTPADVLSQTHTKYWWQCAVVPDHEWEASLGSRVGLGSGCPQCAGRTSQIPNLD